MKIKSAVALGSAIFWLNAAQAQVATPAPDSTAVADSTHVPAAASLAVSLKFGQAQFSGDLSASHAPFYGLGINYYIQRAGAPIAAFLGMDFGFMSEVRNVGDDLPFTEHASLHVGTVLFPMAGVCLPALQDDLRACIGGSIGAVTVDEGKINSQTYGSTVLKFFAPYTFENGFQIGVDTTYFNVYSRANDKPHAFTAFIYGLSTGWELR